MSDLTVSALLLIPIVIPMKMEWNMTPASNVVDITVYSRRRFSLCFSLIYSGSRPSSTDVAMTPEFDSDVPSFAVKY